MLQGVFVSILYCFMNVEVQTVLRKRWRQFKLRRMNSTGLVKNNSRSKSMRRGFLSSSDTRSFSLSRNNTIYGKSTKNGRLIRKNTTRFNIQRNSSLNDRMNLQVTPCHSDSPNNSIEVLRPELSKYSPQGSSISHYSKNYLDNNDITETTIM